MSDLNIKKIEVFACHNNDHPKLIWTKEQSPMHEANIIIRLITNNGIEGYGGILVPTEFEYDRSLPMAMRNLFPHVYNKSIEDRENITRQLLGKSVMLNPMATSPIDIAMWDAYAKYNQTSVCELLGKKRDCIDYKIYKR